MGGGDLNLKKSWAPQIMSNQRRVWAAEKAALDERKKAEQIKKEREEERAIEELRQLQAANGGTTLIDPKVAWMYQDTKAGPGGTSEETEAFLLGKRRVDQIILKQEEEKNVAEVSKQETNPLGVLNVRDITAKTALDPLMAIEKSRNQGLNAMMSDPIMRRRLLKQMGKDQDGDREKKRGRSRRDDSRDRHRSDKRRRYSENDEEAERRERRSHRSSRRLDERSRSRTRRHRHDERGERSHSPVRRRRADSTSPSTPKQRYDISTSSYKRGHHTSREPSRSPSPYRRTDRKRSSRSERARSRSPKHDHRNTARREHTRSPQRDHARLEQRKSASFRPFPSPPDSQPRSDEEAERAAKLAAMSMAANDLEEARNKRLAQMEEQDRIQMDIEERKRSKGGEDRFVGRLRDQIDASGRRPLLG